MALTLTPQRAVLGALLIGGLAGFAAGAPNERQRSFSYEQGPESRAVDNLGRALSAELTRYVVARRADSIRRSLPRELGAGLHIRVSRTLDAAAAADLQDAVTSAWHRIDGTSAVPVVVALVLDTTTSVLGRDWREGSGTFMPLEFHLPRAPGDPCLVVAVIPLHAGLSPAGWARRRGQVHGLISRLVPGPCGFTAAFGPPGPAMTEWLESTGGMPAAEARWAEPLSPLAQHVTPGPVDRSIYRLWSSADLLLLGCIRGDLESCAAWPWMAQAFDFLWWQRRNILPGVLRVQWNVSGNAYRHDAASQLLTYLVRDLGRSTFQQLWASTDRDFGGAFEAAAGESFGSWVYRWTRRRIGSPPRDMSQPVAAYLWSVLLAAACLGGALAYASRRTVSS